MAIDSVYLEQCIIKTMLLDDEYAFKVVNAFKEDYFDTPGVSSIFTFIKNNLKKYGELPQKGMILNDSSDTDDIKKFFDEIDNIEYDVSKNHDWLIDTTNEYLKDKAIKSAIMKGVDIIEGGEDYQKIRDVIEEALCKDLTINLGTNYFDGFGARIQRIINSNVKRVPSYYPEFDEYLNGGFLPYTLNVIGATIGKGKSLFMANMAARQVQHGHNVALMSMEMSEDIFAQRFDSIYSKVDINRMYINKSVRSHMIKEIAKLIKNENTGKLFIKEFPTGNATVNDFRIYLRELKMRKINIDIIYCDYLGIIKAEHEQGNLYIDVKRISEQLRSLSLEFNIPIVTATQINRDGSKLDLKELDHNYTAESSGVPATADFMVFFGDDEDLFTYENEIHWKIIKNRLGGRVGDIKKFYIDTRSLKMYCETEYQEWIDDVKTSNDTRKIRANVN